VAFSRWDPFRDLLALHQRLDRLTSPDAPGWTPPVDLYETPDHYVITAEVGGLTRADVDVQVREGRLTLRGRRADTGLPCERYHRVERGHGTFSRTFELPQAIAADDISADLCDGVLTVTVPKRVEPARKVPVE